MYRKQADVPREQINTHLAGKRVRLVDKPHITGTACLCAGEGLIVGVTLDGGGYARTKADLWETVPPGPAELALSAWRWLHSLIQRVRIRMEG